MRLFSALVGSVCLFASGQAVFDLQTVARYTPSGISPTRFLKAVEKPGGGFVVGGTVGPDALLVDFDANGSVLRSVFWDSPTVKFDSVDDMHRYPDGKILIRTPDFLVQFSPSFAVNWEKADSAPIV